MTRGHAHRTVPVASDLRGALAEALTLLLVVAAFVAVLFLAPPQPAPITPFSPLSQEGQR